jgi:hypothetical protein
LGKALRIFLFLLKNNLIITDAQLQYTEGQEDDLISRLMDLVKRDRAYIIFTLKKALADIDNNRL